MQYVAVSCAADIFNGIVAIYEKQGYEIYTPPTFKVLKTKTGIFSYIEEVIFSTVMQKEDIKPDVFDRIDLPKVSNKLDLIKLVYEADRLYEENFNRTIIDHGIMFAYIYNLDDGILNDVVGCISVEDVVDVMYNYLFDTNNKVTE